jgi:hypothetical protein
MSSESEMIMESHVKAFLQTFYSDDMKGDPERYRRSIRNGPEEYQQRLKQGLADLISTRELTADELWKSTWIEFDDDDELYRSLQETYDFLFGGSDRPPAVHD